MAPSCSAVCRFVDTQKAESNQPLKAAWCSPSSLGLAPKDSFDAQVAASRLTPTVINKIAKIFKAEIGPL
jgi:hypothetical protein